MPQQPTPLTWDSDSHFDDPLLTWDGFKLVNSGNTAMPNDNRVSTALTAEQKQAFQDAISAINGVIAGFSVNLTPTERQRLPSIGQERAGMLDACLQEMVSNPNMIPGFVSLDEVQKDVALIRDLMVYHQSTKVLEEKVGDILKAGSSDAFLAFASFYVSVKDARRRNVPGADAVYSRLAPYFSTRNGGPTPPTEPTPPPTIP